MAPKTLPASSPANLSTAAFVRVTDKGGEEFLAQGNVLQAYGGIASGSRDRYQGYDTNTSLRNQFTRADYEFFRPNESVPTKPLEIISACRNAYRRVGIIRNVMDLMADFGAQGAKVTHPNPQIQKFYRGWFKKVQGPRICERFLNLLYREAHAFIKRTTGKLPFTAERQMRALGKSEKLEPEMEVEKPLTTKKRNIPLRYNFLNPLSLKAVGGELAQFVGRSAYSVKISFKLRQAVQSPKTKAEKDLVDLLPKDIKTAIQRGDQEIPLDPNKVMPFFYKKDDWQEWADPMTYAIMDDLILLEKMKIADLAALDGAISQIRLWKLGDIKEGIFPTDAAFARLEEILLSNPGGGAFDIMWGPELTVEEYKTNVHQFLGKEKYEPVWNSIYAGLGVPPTLTGAATASGFTNNYISLQTLVQRLEYGRGLLRTFWQQEIELVRQAMGFQQGAKLEFDNMVLSDEAAEKALYIQLVDRDIISVETLVERFGELPEFETMKLKKEAAARKTGKMRPKAGPHHTPEKVYEMMKIALGRGYIAPEQTGMVADFPEEFLDVESPFDEQLAAQEKIAAMKPAPGSGLTSKPKDKKKGPAGRPSGSKDSSRKTRKPKPSGASDDTAAYLTAMMWTRNAQTQISNIVTPAILSIYGKKTLRGLSAEQIKKAEQTKFSVLCQIPVYSNIDDPHVREIAAKGSALPAQYQEIYDVLYQRVMATQKSEPTIDEVRMIQASAYAALNCDEEQIYSNGDDE